MPLKEESSATRRRRGSELENALLTAAWDELVERGYDAFTVESVAERAQTARAVIYRRWPTKPELVRAAIAHHGLAESVTAPDIGSLREDLIALLRSTNQRRAPVAGIMLSAQLAAFYADTGASFADLREDVLRGRANLIDTVLDRAVERGEADPAKLTPRVRSVAYDLLRHELVMTHRPVPDDTIVAIVDEIVLPLVRPT